MVSYMFLWKKSTGRIAVGAGFLSRFAHSSHTIYLTFVPGDV